MGMSSLSSQAVIGEFYRVLAQDAGQGWVNAIARTAKGTSRDQ